MQLKVKCRVKEAVPSTKKSEIFKVRTHCKASISNTINFFSP